MNVDLSTAMGERVPVILMVSSMSEMIPQPVGSAKTVLPGVTKQGDGSEFAVVVSCVPGGASKCSRSRSDEIPDEVEGPSVCVSVSAILTRIV